MRILLSLILFILSTLIAHALEVDEKLTMRVLKLSETRKTMLVNRGTEDGLADGDHAKFYVSSGVVARGVIVKISPSRSVWSIYRLVNADQVVTDSVMSLKITPPVKLTMDESKMIVQEDTPVELNNADPQKLGIPMAEGAEDLPEGMTLESRENALRAEIAALQNAQPKNIRGRNLELWAGLSMQSLGVQTSDDSPTVNTFPGNDSRVQLSANLEYYYKNEKEWWSRFSPYGFVNIHNRMNSAFQGSKQTESITEFGGGINYHPWAMPSTINEFIGFMGFGFGLGQISSIYEPGAENPGGPTDEATGSSISYSIGGGFKFYTATGWGARVIFDYYTRGDTLTESLGNTTWTRTASGPRLLVGMGYRW
jgi:hypothetical protein